ncbi:MAG: IBR domain-containing protein [Proteobacteria bacterium]|nr:IBR domain-containing protein [Pseudomonadota bacterium]
MNFIQCPFCNCEYRIDPEFVGNTIKCQKCEKSFEAIHVYQKNRKPNLEDLALAYDAITKEQLEEALSIKKAEDQLGNAVNIEDIFLQKGMIDPEQLEMLKEINQFLELRLLDKKFGKIAINKGFLTDREVKLALSVQAINFKKKKYCRLIGDILIESGVMNESQRDEILMEQKRLDGVLPQKANESTAEGPKQDIKQKFRAFVQDVRDANIQNLIITFTQRRALIVISAIALITVSLIIYAATVKPKNYKNVSDSSFLSKIFEKDKRYFVYPFKYSTTLSDQAFLNLEMDVEFTDINGFEEFERKEARLRHAFNLVFNPRSYRQVKGEKKIHTTLKRIFRAQMDVDITNVYVTKYILTEPPESDGEDRPIDDTAFKFFKLK